MKYYVKELGKYATIVDRRFEGLMNRYPWTVSHSGYVVTSSDSFIDLHGTRTLSRALLGLGKFRPEHLVCDHINRDRLDNRLVNLRAVTQRVNVMNRDVNHIGKKNLRLSPKAIKVLRYICDSDVFPTYREMQEEFGYPSPNSITQYMKALTAKGLIYRDEFGYHVTKKGYRLASGEKLHVPQL